MKNSKITDSIVGIGAEDKEIPIFENQYQLPNGMSYNSYLIKDEKNLVFDTIDQKLTNQWLENLERELEGQAADYLVISHLEPDHAFNIGLLAKKYPEMKLIGNATTFRMLPNFFELDLSDRMICVKEGETLSLGKHVLQFFMAPMVHWPEVMVTYEQTQKILFSADAFGRFGVMEETKDWVEEARRYYFNIVGKYGLQVQALLKKVANLDIQTICPLHGPILNENLSYYINLYDRWSRYEKEKEGILIACASIYGNTKQAAWMLKEILERKTKQPIILMDLVEEDPAEALSKAFCYNKIILMSSSYNAGVFPPMEEFLRHLEGKNYQKRKVGIVENGSWAPSAAKGMKAILENLKEIEIVEPVVTIQSTMKDKTKQELEELADVMLIK